MDRYLTRIGGLAPRAAGEDILVSVLPDAPRSVLDLGCGDGRLAALVLEHRPSLERVAAVDSSPAMLEYARSHSMEMIEFRFGSGTLMIRFRHLEHSTLSLLDSLFTTLRINASRVCLVRSPNNSPAVACWPIWKLLPRPRPNCTASSWISLAVLMMTQRIGSPRSKRNSLGCDRPDFGKSIASGAGEGLRYWSATRSRESCGEVVWSTSSASNLRTLRSISFTIGRTWSTDLPAGSSNSQSRYRFPGYTGHVSPQPIVTITSAIWAVSLVSGFGNSVDGSSPCSLRIATTDGLSWSLAPILLTPPGPGLLRSDRAGLVPPGSAPSCGCIGTARRVSRSCWLSDPRWVGDVVRNDNLFGLTLVMSG